MSSSEDAFPETISAEVLASIDGRERLIQHLGYWPSFHDFEVVSIALERAVVSATAEDLRVTFLVFDLKRRPDDPGRKQGTAEFLFREYRRVAH